MDFLIELGKETVTKLGELVVASTMKHFKYLTQHKKVTANLEEEFENLKMIKQALQTRVNIERRKGYEIEPIVQKWLSDVTAIENEWQKWIVAANKNKKCFGGQCSDLTFNYSLGKQATKSIEYITSLKEEKNNFKDISYPKAPLTLGSTFTKDIKRLLSRKKIMKEVIEKLKDDQVKMISICGMGGVGKTTLVKELIKTTENSKMFDEVAMAVVSQDINYEKIQIQIAEVLGMELKKDTLQGRAMQLLERLGKGKKVLIVLDDVWDILDFECVGLPFREQEKFCKILITSRDEKVCQKMGCNVNVQVSTLLEDEAWYLFREMVGEVIDRPDINPIAREVAKECGGLPLAIATVGRALNNEGKPAWEDALRQLRNFQSSSLSDVEKFVYPRIELSLKFLDSREHKLILMLCGLFPEDFDIPIESLLHHAMGLGLFKDISASWKARNRVHTLVGDLKRKFLLLDSNVPGCVKLHDIVHNVAVSVALKNAQDKYMVQDNIKNLKEEKMIDIKAISLILDDTCELENGLECPTLKLLQVMSKSKEPIFWPELFFQGMSVLKVLSMQNLCIPKMPSLSQASINLHMLRLEHCDVGDISIIGKELIHLEVLSFAHSNIKELPIEIGNLGSLRLLDLTECNDLNVIFANVFIRLSQLEELYLRMYNFPWKKNDVAINELKKISHQLKVIEIKVRGTEIFVNDLDFSNLQKFWVYIDPYTNFHRFAYLESNLLQISGVSYQSINNILMISQLIKKGEIVEIRKVKDLKNVMGQLIHDCPNPNLKDLRVKSCPDMKCLIDYTVHCNGFPQIRSLCLEDLKNLKEICYTSDHYEAKGFVVEFSYLVNLKLILLASLIGFNKTIDFDDLNQVKRTSCVQSEKLFSSNWMQQFPKLETILLKDCSSINVVFDTQRSSHLDGQVFPQLKEIDIENLEQLRHVWSKSMHCVQGFQNLKSLSISRCRSLRHVFTPSIIRAITNIEKLVIHFCALIEYLISDDEEGDHNNKEKETVISFEKLDSLTLSALQRIASVCANSYAIQFPSLRKLVIENCSKLDILCFLTAYTEHNNHSVASYSNHNGNDFKNFSRSSNLHFGCMPLCSKLMRQSNTNNKINKAPSISERKPWIELGVAPLLEELYVKNCDLLLQGMDHTRIRGTPVIKGHLFPNLKSIIMENCDIISVLLSFLSMGCLEHLEKLYILKCKNLNEIVSQEESESESNGENITFPALQHLLLKDLPKLKAFFHGPKNLDFPSLQRVDIKDCPNMELFSHGFCTTPKLKNVSIAIGSLSSSYIDKNDMNATIQGFKSFVELHRSEILSWRVLCDKGMFGYFVKEQSINITGFHRLSTIVPFSEMRSLQHVRELNVSNCDSLIEVFESVGEVTQRRDAPIQYQLQKMTLNHLPISSQIWKHNITEFVIFQNLREIQVSKCQNLKNLLSHSMARSLVQLQNIVVENCETMEEIITKGDEYIEGGNKVKTIFPKLEEMRLLDLPMLECVCSGNYDYDLPLCIVGEDNDIDENSNNKIQISFPELKVLELRGVPKLRCFCSGVYDYDIMVSSIEECLNIATFPYGNVIVNTPNLHKLQLDWIDSHTHGDLNLLIYYLQNSDKFKVELQKLETLRYVDEELIGYIKRVTDLDIVNCHKLLNCIPSNMMHLFSHLKELTVERCDFVEEIFESNDYMLQCKLSTLNLFSLPKLKHIWKNHCQVLGFECLVKIIISQCNDLEYVFPDVSVVTNLPNLLQINVYECKKMKEIIGNNCNPINCVQQKAKTIISLNIIQLENLPSLKCFGRSCFLSYVELPDCFFIMIKTCPELKVFWYDGIVYTPNLRLVLMDSSQMYNDLDLDVND